MKKKSKDQKLLEANKDKYVVKEEKYGSKIRLELWRKNPKGFYNVVCYINSKEEANEAILKDIKNKGK